VSELAIVSLELHGIAVHEPPEKTALMPHVCVPPFVKPERHEYEHTAAVTPEHWVSDPGSVRPDEHGWGSQLPPVKALEARQMCVPVTTYPELQLKEHTSSVAPLQVVGDLSIVRPELQGVAVQAPP
jgi:hypothetical protein